MSLSLWKTEMPAVKRFITLVFTLLKYEKNLENSPPPPCKINWLIWWSPKWFHIRKYREISQVKFRDLNTTHATSFYFYSAPVQFKQFPNNFSQKQHNRNNFFIEWKKMLLIFLWQQPATKNGQKWICSGNDALKKWGKSNLIPIFISHPRNTIS